MIGASRPLPDDLFPLVVTDASARVRDTYKALEASKGNVVQLAHSQVSYERVRFHLSVRACGKHELRVPDKRDKIFRQIAKVMDTTPDERWLIISYKQRGLEELGKELRTYLTNPVEFELLTWGKHFATNDFKNSRNIIVLGSLRYPEPAYAALAIAAAGKQANEVDFDSLPPLRHGEFKHHMLQAVLRGNARNSALGIAGECNVYVIASALDSAHKLLPTIFPNAHIEEWGKKPDRKPSKNEQALISAIETLLPAGASEVTKSDLCDKAGLSSKTELTRQLKRPAVSNYLAAQGIVMHRTTLVREEKLAA